jgi:hypothetical protein
MMRLPLTGMKDMVQSTLDMVRVRKDISVMVAVTTVDMAEAVRPLQLKSKLNRNYHHSLVENFF